VGIEDFSKNCTQFFCSVLIDATACEFCYANFIKIDSLSLHFWHDAGDKYEQRSSQKKGRLPEEKESSPIVVLQRLRTLERPCIGNIDGRIREELKSGSNFHSPLQPSDTALMKRIRGTSCSLKIFHIETQRKETFSLIFFILQ